MTILTIVFLPITDIAYGYGRQYNYQSLEKRFGATDDLGHASISIDMPQAIDCFCNIWYSCLT